MNKRWRELADNIVDGIKEDKSGWGFKLADDIEQAIETAVAEERARTQIVWPSEEDFKEFIYAQRVFPSAGHMRDWLRKHAKVGVGE